VVLSVSISPDKGDLHWMQAVGTGRKKSQICNRYETQRVCSVPYSMMFHTVLRHNAVSKDESTVNQFTAFGGIDMQ
jgi:hypothetical protein